MKFGKNTQPGALDQAVTALKFELADRGTDLVNAQTANAMINTASLESAAMRDLEDSFGSATHTLDEIMSGVGIESLSQAQLEAGTMALMAAGAPAAYAERACGSNAISVEGVTLMGTELFGSNGSVDYRESASLEAFDDQELSKHIPFSVVYNVQASRQDAFAELFYPTSVVPAEQAGVDLSIPVTTVMNELRRNLSGDAADFERRNILDAMSDHSILENLATKIVPYVDDRGTNADKFVAPALVASKEVEIAGVAVPTAPLAMGKTIDVLSISQVPGLIGSGVMDTTDSLDTSIKIDKLFMSVTDGTTTEVLRFETARLPRSAFVKSIEGGAREMSLQFTTKDLVVSKLTKLNDNSDSTLLAAIVPGEYTVKLAVDVNGSADVETGNVKVYSSPVEVVAVFDATGDRLPLGTGEGATIAGLFTDAAVFGYNIDANRTNSNRRTRGLLVDTQVYTERYTIPLGAPISTPAPTNSNREASDLASLITTTRIGITNDAVTTLLNYAEMLETYVTAGASAQGVQLEGIARLLVVPFFERRVIDMEAVINSTSSHERAKDVSAVLVDTIRDIAYRMFRDSRYGSAMEALNGGSSEKPQLVLCTDAVLIQHLMVSGDSRTLGVGFDVEMAATPDGRMDNTIIITFARKGAAVDDVLSFGTHGWIPELTSTATVTRNGAMSKEVMVQKRSRHVNKLPIMAVIKVENLDKVMGYKVPVLVQGAVSTS